MQGLRFQWCERCQNHLCRKTARQGSRAGEEGNASSSPLTASPAPSVWNTEQESRDHKGDFSPAEEGIRSESCREQCFRRRDVAVVWDSWRREQRGLVVFRVCSTCSRRTLCPTRGSSRSSCQCCMERQSWTRPGFPPKDTNEAFKSLNKPPLLRAERDVKGDAEFVSLMKF